MNKKVTLKNKWKQLHANTWLLSLLFLCCFGIANAQVSGYSFLQTTGTYSAITGTLSTATGDDGTQSALPIGFTFNYNGANHTTFSVTTNGCMTLTNAAPGSWWVNSLNAAPSTNCLAPLWDDNNATGGSVRYTTTGTAPNRVLTVQWAALHIGGTGSSTSPTANFQVQLFETSNVLRFIYGTTSAALTSTTASIGITGASGNYLSVTPGSPATVSSTTANNSISSATLFPNGTVYEFTPPPVPTITSFTGTSGCAGSDTIVIDGTNFIGVTAANTRINGLAVSSIVSFTSTQIRAIIGNTATSGTVSVITGGGTGTSTGTYTINAAPGVPTSTPTSATISPATTASFTASGTGGTFNWFTTPTGGTPVFTGASYTTDPLCANATFYVSETAAGCTSASRLSVAVTVTIPSITRTPATGLICITGDSIILDANPMGALTYTWAGAGLSASTGAIVSSFATSTTIYTVTADYGTCTATNTVNVGVLTGGGSAPVPTATPPIACFSPTDSVLLNSNLSATSFGVAAIPYAPITVPGTATAGPSGDDVVGGPYSIPFTYNFFGNLYNQFYISTNGNIQFGPTTSTSFTPGLIPDVAAPNNFVALGWADLLTTASTIKYFVSGIAPLRVLVIDFNGATFFGGSGSQSGQIHLFESTGIVEVHLTNSTGVASTGGGVKSLGVENIDGTIGAAAPGRNNTAWTTTAPEAYRFTPPAAYSFLWTPGGTRPTQGTTSVLAPAASVSPYVYNLQATNPITGCITNSTVSFLVNNVPGSPSVSPTSTTVSAGDTATFTASGAPGATFTYYTDSIGGTVIPSTGGVLKIVNCTSGTTTYWVEQTVGICNSPIRTRLDLTINPIGAPSVTPISSTVLAGDTAIFVASGLPGATFAYYDAPTAGTVIPSTAGVLNITSCITGSNQYYAEQSISGCPSNSRTNITLNIDPLSAPTGTNSFSCNNPAIPTCSVASTNGTIATHTYAWYDIPLAGSGTLLQLGTSTTFTGTLTVSDTFYVEERNGLCSSPRTMVIAEVAPAITMIISSVPATNLICNPTDSVVLTLTTTRPGSTYLWTGGPNTTPTSATTSAKPTVTSNYIVVEDSAGCTRTAQVGVGVLPSLPITPFVSPNPVTSCVDSIQLNSNLSAGNFTVASIPYSLITVPGTATAGPSGDDVVGGPYTIPFTFNYFGNLYTQFYISTNGNVQFGPTTSTSFTPGLIPDVAAPNNFVALGWADLLTTASTIKYFVSGIAPLRVMVIDFNGATFFGGSGSQSGQIRLFESTGIVEVHLTNSTGVASTGGGVKSLGVENLDGSIGAAATGRNNSAWTTTVPEAWRFTPPAAYTYSWTPTTGLNDPTSSTPNRAPIATLGTFTYNLVATNPITGCTSSASVNIIRTYSVGNYFDTITATGAYLFNGVYLVSTGIYRDTVISGSGCDSIVILHLAVIPNPLYSNDNACSPINVSPILTLGSPYLAAGYATINTHTDTFIQSNFLATVQAGEPIGSCGSAGLDNRTMWYKFTMPFCSAPQVHISSDDRSNTDFDTRISVYRRSAPFLCTSPFTEVACSDNDIYYLNTGATTNSAVVLTPNNITPTTNEYMPGEDLYVQVSGVGPARGNYGLIVDVEPYVPTATAVTAGSATIDWSATSASTWGSISGAYIQWRPVGSTSAGTYRYVAAPANTTTITGLIPGTAYEYWASYVCGNGGRWWTRKGTFTTSTTCTGTSPVVVSVVSGTPCNRPVVSFDATASGYTSYRVMLRRVGGTNVSTSGAFYSSPSTQTYTTSSLVLGGTYQFWVVAFCGTDRVDSSAITTFTVCSSLRSANPNVTEATDEDQDVAYVLPNGDVVYGVPFNAMDLQIDVTNPNAQEITLGTIDANTYFGRTAVAQEVSVASVGDLVIYPNPATTEATLSYSLTKESTSMNIRIVDAQGKEMLNEMVSNPTMEGTYNINLNNYSAGVYFVKVQAGDYIQTKKLIVDKR